MGRPYKPTDRLPIAYVVPVLRLKSAVTSLTRAKQSQRFKQFA